MASSVNNTIEKAKGFFKSRRGEFTLLAVLSTLALLFTVILYSVRLSDYIADGTNRGDLNLWTAKLFNARGDAFLRAEHRFYNRVCRRACVICDCLYSLAYKKAQSCFLCYVVLRHAVGFGNYYYRRCLGNFARRRYCMRNN